MTSKEALENIKNYLDNDDSDLGIFAFTEEINTIEKDLELLELIRYERA